MSDETHNDYSAVEQALKQNEAPVRMRERVGRGLMAGAVILAIGVAIPLAALGIGKAIHMAKEEKIVEVEKVVEVEKIVEVPAPMTALPNAPVPEVGTKITRNYVIFQDVSQTVGGEDMTITTGHDYASSEQETYDRAFCYTQKNVNGMDVRISLSTKLPGSLPQNALDLGWQNAGLSSADLAELRNLCPYL